MWFGKFIRRNSYHDGRDPDFSLAGLNSYVGKPLTVYYINCDEPEIVSCFLHYTPVKDAMSVMHDGIQRIIRVDTVIQDQRDAIHLILDENGKELYRNDAVPFDINLLPKPRKVRTKVA